VAGANRRSRRGAIYMGVRHAIVDRLVGQSS
jgi:hypothetical protein